MGRPLLPPGPCEGDGRFSLPRYGNRGLGGRAAEPERAPVSPKAAAVCVLAPRVSGDGTSAAAPPRPRDARVLRSRMLPVEGRSLAKGFQATPELLGSDCWILYSCKLLP